MRISDWSSDVCSSDLQSAQAPELALVGLELRSGGQYAVHQQVRDLLERGPGGQVLDVVATVMEVIAAAADSAQRCIAGGGTGQGHRLLRLGQGGRGVAHRHAPVVFRLRSGHFTAFGRTPVRFPPAPALAVSKVMRISYAVFCLQT